jgi:tRNA threonylcarbamoyladenosine biosynthesis protein TsaE
VTLGTVTASVSETQAVAASLADLAQPGDLLLLAGELGAGKTAFVQGFAKGLGIDEVVTSPTFILVRTYEGGRLRVHHVDVYRLESLQEALDLGLAEMVDDGSVTLIEWGDVVAPALPTDFLEVRLGYGAGDDERTLALRTVGPRWSSCQAALRRLLDRAGSAMAPAPVPAPADGGR